MSLNIEGDKSINSSELKLSKIEVNKQALVLMAEFKDQLYNLEEFRKAASGFYLNFSHYNENKYVDAPSEVGFDVGGSTYSVRYSFSAKEQSLMITKRTLGVSCEKRFHIDPWSMIILKSRRFEDRKPIGSAKIEWYCPVGDARIDDSRNHQVNTAFAVQKVREMLGGLSSQK